MAKKYFGVSRKDEHVETGRRIDKSSTKQDKQIMSAPVDKDDFNQFLQEQQTQEQRQADIVRQLENEQKHAELVKQSQAQEKLYSGIVNFFDASYDRAELGQLFYDKKDGKWYKMDNGGMGYSNDRKEISFQEVQNIMEKSAGKMSTSGGYQAGIATSNAISKAFEDGVWGTVYGLGSLISRGITGNWDEVSTNQIKSMGNMVGSWLNSAGKAYYEQGEKWFEGKDDWFSNVMWGDMERNELKSLREDSSRLEKEHEQIRKEGQVALEKRFQEEKARRASGEKSFLDKVYDWTEVGKDNEWMQQQHQLKSAISERAMELEGRSKKSFTNVEDKTLSTKTINYNGQEIPLEKMGGDNGNSKSIWDVKKLVIDASGKPVKNTDGTLMYTDKYTFADKVMNSNWDVLSDAYYLQDDFAEGIGTAIGFVAGGKGTSAVVGAATKGLGRVAGLASKAMNLESRAFSYTNKLLNFADNAVSPFGKTVGAVDRVAFDKALNKIGNKVSTAVQTTANSYIMSNTESEQIGRDAQRNVLNSQIDKYAGIDVNTIAHDLAAKGGYKSDAYLFVDAQAKADQLRQDWATKHPELFNEILLQSQIAQETARALNNINFINNLTSAGLFVKGKSFARNILSNPFSIKSLIKGAWTIGREMFQEGFIEEGVINSFAQKAGEQAGALKFYDTSDFFKNDVGSSDFAENVFAGALLGGLQTGLTHAVESKHAYQQFREQKRVINELSSIGNLDTKENIKKVIEYSLDKANNETIARRMDELLKEGKEEEANALADTLLLNKSVKAASSGTTEVLNNSLKKLMDNENLDEHDKMELQKAINFNNRIADIFDAHVQYNNKSSIIENRGNKELLESYKQEILQSLPKLQEEYDSTLDRVARQQLSSEVSDYLNDNYNEILENKKQSITLDENQHRSAKELNDAKRQLKKLQDVQDELDDKYEYMISDKGQKEFIRKVNDMRRRNVVNSVNENNVDEVKQNLQNNDELTPEVNSQINQTVEGKIVKNNTDPVNPIDNSNISQQEITNPTGKENAIEDTKSVAEPVREKAKEEFSRIAKDSLFDDDLGDPSLDDVSNQEIADANEAINLQPASLNNENPKHQSIVRKYSKVMQDLNQNVNTDFGTNLSPKEMLGLFASSVGFDVAEKHFNFFKQAFEDSNIPVEEQVNWDNLYNRYFEPAKNFSFTTQDEVVETPTTVEEVKEQDAETNSIIQEDSKPIGYTQNNTPIKYLGRKIANAMAKIPFLGIKYRAIIDEITGTVTYVDDAEGELNTEGMANLNVILNPDILVPGKKFLLEIPQDWKTRTVSDWVYNQVGVLVQTSMTMEEWMSKYNVEEGSDKWLSKVPMDMILDGINIGPGVHDVAWWNSRNVADFKDATINGEKLSPEQAIQQQRKVAQQGQDLTMNIRKAVYAGNNEMVISKREEGHTLTNADGKLNSLQEANPDTQLSIFSPQGFIINKGDNGNEYFNGKIVNADVITDKGHIFMISRLGTENINGKNVPTYVAHKVHTNYNQEGLRELAKSRQRLYDAADILNRTGKFIGATQEQVNWAERVRDQVKAMTGISIDNVSMDNGSIQYTALGKIKQLYPLPVKNGQGLMLLPQLANVNNQKLPIVHEDGSVTNYKSEAGEGYKAMLMDNLHTQKKFHKISDGNGGTINILDIQPKIQFEPTNKSVSINPVVEERKEKVKKATEKINNIQDNNEEVKEDKPIKEITFGERRRVIQYLFNNILNSIDISKDFTNQDVINKIKNSFEDHLEALKNNPNLKSEYEYLLENKDSILGLNEFKNDVNTVKSELESFLSQDFTDEEKNESVNDEGAFEKNNNKASFENDVRTSLSTKLKMFFSGIVKTNNTITEDFAGLNEYYTADEVIGALQDMLVNISNDPESFRNKVQNQIEKNPEEFGFLQDVLDKFNSADVEVQKEILFRLNQTKNEMYFVMYSKGKNGNYTLMVYDANSKNPNIKTKLEYQENLKQSDLIVNFGDTYRVKEEKARELIQQYESWKGNYLNISNKEYADWLSNFGIQVSEKTIQDYKDGLVEGSVNFNGNFLNNGGVFGTLMNNLTTALQRQKENPEILFKYKNESKSSKDGFNILLNNNNGFLKTLINVQVNNTFNLASSMYIGGKTINSFSQPNYTTEQLRKIKDVSNPLVNNLKQSAFSQNSLLLKLIDNAKVRNALNIGYVSLQSLKQQGQKVYQDSEIVDLSSQDYDLLLQGFFESEGAYFKNQELENRGITLREAKMTFPTLSDSSQMFVFNTIALNLNKGNFVFNENGEVKIGKEVLDVMFDQLVKPDLDRMEAYIKSNGNTNIQGLDIGSQMFTIIPSLNTLPIDLNGKTVKLLTLLHAEIRNGKTVDEVIEKYKEQIQDKLDNVIKDNVDSKIRINNNEISGSWVDNNFVDDKQNVSFLDSKYLNSKGTTNKNEQLKIAAYDYVINYYINQAQIQMLFAGDIANYVQDKQESKFNTDEYGRVDVTKPRVSVDVNENQLEKEQQVYTDIIKASSVNMSKRLKELISPGNRIAESNGEKYIQVMVNDVEESSSTISNLVKMWYPALYEESKNDINKLKQLENKIREGIKKGEPVKVSEKEYKDLRKKLQDKFPEIADYFKITATDAQEYTTWQEHLHILLNQGRIQQSVYDGLYSKLQSQSKDGLTNENTLTKEEKKIIFQPIKPLHAGMYFEDMKDNNGAVTSKLQRYVYVKTSSFPLLPQLTQGLEIDNLRKNIESIESKLGKKVRVSYQSGNKVGAIKNAINMSEMYSEFTPELENKIVNSSIILDRENFSIQQDKPFKTDKNIKAGKRNEINRGTQFEKIILGNGINEITEDIFPNNFDDELLQSLGITPRENISGKDLYTIYSNLYASEQQVLRNQLYNSLGLNTDGNWVNNIETLEHIKNALNKRLSNQQDKEILDLVYIVSQEDKNGKMVNHYYNKKQVDDLGLKPERAEFNIPIWMSPNSRKFESVLNSIVNNKLVNLKLPGFSSPVASQEGFTFKDESELNDKTGIIFTDKYDGQLKATHNEDGSLKYAQVLIASKFVVKKRDEDTGKYKDELLDLKQYTKTLEDGRTVLDMDKISPELLQMFSFRIPTSAHQSGALIEVVGFLPHTSGDLMIVPKDHTTQIGEDYDIDTRYVYSQNYRVDSRGNVKKIDAQYIKNKIQQLDDAHNNEAELDARVEDILNLFDVFKNNEEIQSIFEQDKVSKEQKVQILKDKLNHLLIENQIIDVYKSVFSSTDEKVQKMIGATLSTQFAEDTAELIDNKLNSQKDDSNFSIFDDRHQKSILKLGASGKLGIGVHSNWVVLNSLFQQMENKPTLVNGYNQETGQAIPFSMRIGEFVSHGKLGQTTALEPETKKKGFVARLLSVINMENQNSATDNQKLQIMGRRNENKYTINVFALMSNLGFDKDILKDGTEVSLPSLFISQPIIRRYVELKEKYDSITSDYQDNVEDKIKEQLVKEFGNGVDLVATKQGLFMNGDQMKIVEKTELTAQRLYDSLIKGNNAQQWAVYEKFMELSNHSKNITKVQQLANIDSDGLGISFFNTINKKDALLYNMTSQNLNIDGIEKLFGDKITVETEDTERQNELLNNGYIKVQQFDNTITYVKPTTPLNAKLISTIASGYNLWQNVLPFENQFIDQQIQNILGITGKEDGTKAGTELKYKIISEMKDFIYSYSNLGIFDNNVENEREKLFIDNDTNESLASYLNKLKKNKNKLFNEPFFKELEFVLNKGNKPSLIKYTTNDRTNFNKNSVYTIFSILNDSKESLPAFNGDNNYTWEKLAKDLTKYSLLSNQENGAIGFRNYIPLSILNKYKVSDNLRNYSGVGKNLSHNLLLNGDFKALMNLAGTNKIEDNTIEVYDNSPENKVRINTIVQRLNTKYGTSSVVYNEKDKSIYLNGFDNENFRSVFTRQFFQHNPEEAKKFNWKTNKEWMDKSNSESLDTLQWFVPTTKTVMPEYISIRDSENSKFLLFENDGNGIYKRINTLGTFGFNEYSPFNNNVESLVQDNNVISDTTTTVQPVITDENKDLNEIKSELKLDQGLSAVINNIAENSKNFSEVAKFILPFINENIPINIIDMPGINGMYIPQQSNKTVVNTSFGNLNVGSIYLSEKLLQGRKEMIYYTIIEEVVHSITSDEVNKYVDTSKSYINENGEVNIKYIHNNPPSHIVKLVSLFKQGSKHILDKYSKDTSLEEAINRLNQQKALWNKDTNNEFYTNEVEPIGDKSDFRHNTYRTLNLAEFIAGVMLDPTFRKEMDSVEYRQSGKSILNQIADVISRIIKSVSPNAVKDSITEHSFDAILKLLKYNQEEVSPVSKTNITQEMKNTDKEAEQLLDEPLFDPDKYETPAEYLLSDDNDIEFGDPSNDSRDENSVDLQPIGLNDILDIETC